MVELGHEPGGAGGGEPRRPGARVVALGLFLVAVLLVFPRLGERALWQDEAETALVGSNVLTTGRPLAWDGRLLVTQEGGLELTDSFLWGWTPWLQHYVAALGMAVAGETSFGARWPFALAGCASFPLLYLLVVRFAGSRKLALLSAAFLLGSVQFLLLLRQCRYYALLPPLFIVAVAGYLFLPARRGVALLSLGLVLAFHANPVSCAIAAAGLGLHAALFRREAPVWKALLASGAIVAAFSVPWVLATGLLARAPAVSGRGRDAGLELAGTLLVLNRSVCSFPVLAGLWGTFRRRKGSRPPPRLLELEALSGCALAPVLVFLPTLLWANPRYVSFLLPVGAFLTATSVLEVWRRKAWAGATLAAVALGTELLALPFPALLPAGLGHRLAPAGEVSTGADALRGGVLRRELPGYLHELTHTCRGPDEAIAGFLSARTATDDVVYVTNGALPAMFHTRRRFAGLLSPDARRRPGWDALPEYLFDLSLARWLILRPTHPLGAAGPARDALLSALEKGGIRPVRRFRLDVDDIRWINRPMLSVHVFDPAAASPGSGPIEVLELERRLEGGGAGPARRLAAARPPVIPSAAGPAPGATAPGESETE